MSRLKRLKYWLPLPVILGLYLVWKGPGQGATPLVLRLILLSACYAASLTDLAEKRVPNLLVGALAELDFGRAFVLFHALFFPGKDNWLFDPRVDQIINILPQEFFRSCAILILALLALGCAVLILWDILRRKHPH